MKLSLVQLNIIGQNPSILSLPPFDLTLNVSFFSPEGDLPFQEVEKQGWTGKICRPEIVHSGLFGSGLILTTDEQGTVTKGAVNPVPGTYGEELN